MTVCYLEIDDEITTAIGRLRAVPDGEAVIVVPPGARIATSRINFKLLAREANERRLNIAAVSDDPAVRALAISAGLPTYDTLAAAEQALATFREQDRQLAERIGRAPGEPAPRWSSTRWSETRVMPSPLVEAPPVDGRPAGAAASAGEVAAPPVPVSGEALPETLLRPGDEAAQHARRRRARRVPVAPLLVVGLLGLLLAGVAYGAYVFLPTATITIEPAADTLELGTFAVVADPGVAVVDADAGRIPAQRVEVPLQVSGTFAATGVQARETRATGSVRFRSENTVTAVDVAQGTIVATADGIEFVTTQAATVPRADFSTSTPGTVDVAIRAARPGPRGNVAEGAINVLPNNLKSQLVNVRNPQPTEGGRRIEENVVTQEDYDAAAVALTDQLARALSAALASPGSVPLGLTAYPQTATLSDPRPDQDAADLIGVVAPTFSLALDASGQVVAVNEKLIAEIATVRIGDAVAAGQDIVEDSLVIDHAPGLVSGELISYQVTASARVFDALDPASLIGRVRGKTVSEAEAILSQYGMVEIVMWPEFVDRLPEQNSRISLSVKPPAAGT